MKHVEATWKDGNHLSIRSWTQGNQEKPVSRWPLMQLVQSSYVLNAKTSFCWNTALCILTDVGRRFGGNKPELFSFLHAFTGNFLLERGEIRSAEQASELELKYLGN